MMGKFSIVLFTLTVVAILIVVTLPESGRANPSLEDGINVAEAIRYLEKLDKYYSQIARPRGYIHYKKSKVKLNLRQKYHFKLGKRFVEQKLRITYDSPVRQEHRHPQEKCTQSRTLQKSRSCSRTEVSFFASGITVAQEKGRCEEVLNFQSLDGKRLI